MSKRSGMVQIYGGLAFLQAGSGMKRVCYHKILDMDLTARAVWRSAGVAPFEKPRRRPAGLPGWPFGNGRPRARFAVFAVFCSEISVIVPFRSHTQHRPSVLLDPTWNTNIMAILLVLLRQQPCVPLSGDPEGADEVPVYSLFPAAGEGAIPIYVKSVQTQ